MAKSALLRSIFSSSTKLLPNTPLNLITRTLTTSQPNPKTPIFFDSKLVNLSDPSNPYPFLYDPITHKSIHEPSNDPATLLQEFHEMRSRDPTSHAVKVFDEMSKRSLRITHKALELFKNVTVKGSLPDVVTHIAVMEAFANAGSASEAHYKMYLKMLAPGVVPNAYTYSVLIKSLAHGNDWQMHGDAMRYVMEMVGKGMRPDAETCVAVFEACARKKRVVEGRQLLEEMKRKGFVMDGRGVVAILKKKKEPLVRTLMEIMFAKLA